MQLSKKKHTIKNYMILQDFPQQPSGNCVLMLMVCLFPLTVLMSKPEDVTQNFCLTIQPVHLYMHDFYFHHGGYYSLLWMKAYSVVFLIMCSRATCPYIGSGSASSSYSVFKYGYDRRCMCQMYPMYFIIAVPMCRLEMSFESQEQRFA